jgi:hypothetical protein
MKKSSAPGTGTGSGNGNGSSSAAVGKRQAVTQNREEKLRELKKKLAWTCCENLLIPPIAKLERLEFGKSDSTEDKAQKQEEYAAQSREIEYERKMREPELVYAFEAIIDRVRAANYNFSGSNFSYTAVSEAYRSTKIYCNRCNSEVRYYWLVLCSIACIYAAKVNRKLSFSQIEKVTLSALVSMGLAVEMSCEITK